jgi:hypothetical protein
LHSIFRFSISPEIGIAAMQMSQQCFRRTQRRAHVMGHDPVILVDELEFDVQDSNLARSELEAPQ